MLGYIRKKSGGIISALIVGAIALVFVFWGVGGRGTDETQDIKINGQPVRIDDYRRMLDTVREQAQQSQTQIKDLEKTIRQRALSLLVERYCLETLAKNTGRIATPLAINLNVKNNPAFQENGHFSLALYKDLVPRLFGVSEGTYEANIAKDIALRDTASFINGLAYAPIGSIMDDFHFTDDQLALKYVLFDDTSYTKDISPTEEELAEYFQANQETWRHPAETKISYVSFKNEDFMDDSPVDQTELADTYAEEVQNLTTQESAEVSHILIRFPSFNPTDEEKETTLARAKEALARTEKESFETVAKELSEDTTSAVNGGDLGIITRGQMLKEFEEAVFATGAEHPDSKYQIIGPIGTLLGYHIIQLRNYQPSHTMTLEEATDQLTAQIKLRKARRLSADKAEDFIKLAEKTSFSGAAGSLGLTIEDSDFFSTELGAPDFFENNRDNISSAVELPLINQGFPVVDSSQAFVVYSPLEKRASFIPKLTDEDILDKVSTAYIASKASEKALAETEKFLAEAQEKGWDTALDSLKESTPEKGQTPLFARFRFYEGGEIMMMADTEQLLKGLFRLATPGDTAPNPISVNNPAKKGHLAISLAEIVPADESTLNESLSYRRQSTRETIAKSAYAFWISAQMAGINIQLPTFLNNEISGQTAN